MLYESSLDIYTQQCNVVQCYDHSCVSAVGSRTAPYQQQGGGGCREGTQDGDQ